MLSGYFAEPEDESDVDSVLDEIKAVLKEEEKRLERLQKMQKKNRFYRTLTMAIPTRLQAHGFFNNGVFNRR